MVLEDPPKYMDSDTDSSAVWNDAMAEVTPNGPSSVTLLPLSSKYEIFSNFGEKDCGEPSKSQHLVFDFTPDPEIDNEESQLKCCEFWDFINSKGYLKQLCAEPINFQNTATGPTPANAVHHNIHATSFIKHNTNGYVELGLESKMAPSKCTLGNSSYSHQSCTEKITKPPVCICSKICTKCNKSSSRPVSGQNSKVKELCKELDDWDKKHPKSMEPPGAVMQYMPVLQRKIPPPDGPKTCFD